MRIKLYLPFVFLFTVSSASAQKNKQLSVDLKRSFTGTGDVAGPAFAVEYGKFFKSRLEITGSLSADMYHDQYKVLLSSGSGNVVDASYRMVAAGMQLTGEINYAFLRTNQHELKIGAGPLLRYQSSSMAGGYAIQSSNTTGFPELAFTFRNMEPQNVLSAGYHASLTYAYTFTKNFFVGVKASLQNDTNADIITAYGVRIGKRF